MNSLLQKIASKLPDRTSMTLLQKLATEVNDPSNFDETVPPVEAAREGEKDPNSPAIPQDQVNKPGFENAETGEQYEAIPDESMQEDAGVAPEEAGARAAQAFLGPEVMQMALGGDPAAADLVARTAGQIAAQTTMAAANFQMQPAGQMGDQGMMDQGGGQEMAPAINQTTPEDDLASSIAPLPNETLSQVESGGQPATQN